MTHVVSFSYKIYRIFLTSHSCSVTIFTFGFHLFFFAENKPHLYIYLGFRLFEIQFQLNTHYIYNGFQETCHHGSENFFFYLFPFSENGISQLSTRLHRVVLQNSISYKHPCPKPDYLVFSTRTRNGDSERVEERSCGFRVEKARS